MTDTALVVDGLVKAFGRVKAVDQVSFRLAPGERAALIGHNGAGKTTLFKTILGFLAPDGGTLSVAGHRPGSTGARQVLAYLPEAVAFHKALTGIEVLTFYCRLKGEDVRAVPALLEKVGLAEAGRRRVGTYSKGMRQRLGLAQALVGTPSLVLLDEPTSGLDPVSRHDFYALIEEIAARGAAVLLSSHALTEVEAKTDRVLIMAHGRLVADDTLQRLRRTAGLPIRVNVHAARADSADAIVAHLGGRRINGRAVEMFCSADDKLKLLSSIATFDAVEDIEVTTPSLEEIYRHFTGLSQRGA